MSRTGYPPAHSALRLRLALAAFGLILCGGSAGALLAWDVLRGWGVVLAVLAAIAVVDIVVVTMRLRAERGERAGPRARR